MAALACAIAFASASMPPTMKPFSWRGIRKAPSPQSTSNTRVPGPTSSVSATCSAKGNNDTPNYSALSAPSAALFIGRSQADRRGIDRDRLDLRSRGDAERKRAFVFRLRARIDDRDRRVVGLARHIGEHRLLD